MSSADKSLPSSSGAVLAGEERSVRQEPPSSDKTLELRPQDSVYLKEEKLLAAPPPIALMARDLAAFFRISNAIGDIRDLDLLKRRLLELIGEVVPAERGAIVLAGETPEEPDSVYGWRRGEPGDKSVPIDRSLVRKALRESEAILAQEEPRQGQFRSVLCLPLTAGERVLGAVYLESGREGVRFDEEQLQFLSAISGILGAALENTRNIAWLERENRRLRTGQAIKHEMIGSSPAMQKVYRFIAKVAPSESTVLIRGESGTGKELAARAIHMNSPRAERPFLAINCAALTETLLESELFGHEQGAFTGATRRKRGKLELADGGTLFLDELGDLALGLQAKLLRVLQESEFERVGGTATIRVDIRLIAATNKCLEEAMRAATFREDLYYRLNVVAAVMPPLRERAEDIPLLANHFALKHGGKSNRRILGVSPEAEECMLNYSWPGNVRELENAVERAVVLGAGEFIELDDLPETVIESAPSSRGYPQGYHQAVRQFKRELLLKALRQAGGNFSKASRILGIHPNYLHRLVTGLDLREELGKGS